MALRYLPAEEESSRFIFHQFSPPNRSKGARIAIRKMHIELEKYERHVYGV